MVYLGIDTNGKKEIFSFETKSVRDRVADKAKGSIKFDSEKAAKEKIGSVTIQDGRIAMDRYDSIYLAVEGTPFDGVYCFRTEKRMLEASQRFENSKVFWDVDEVCKKYNLSYSDIRDGGYLMSGMVMDWCKANVKKEKKESDKKDIKVEKENPVENKDSSVVSDFKAAIKSLASKKDVIELHLSDGEVIRIAYRPLFYKSPELTLSNTASMTDGVITLKEDVIDKMLANDEIFVLKRSGLQYNGVFLTITNCDDAYSPNLVQLEHPKFEHGITSITININQIVTIQSFDSYSDIAYEKISSDKYNLLYSYLKKKFVE